MYLALKAPPDSGIQRPGEIRSAEDEDTSVVVTNAVHLDEQLGFEAGEVRGGCAGRRARTAEGVDLVDKDYGGFFLAGELEEEFD